MRAEDASRVGTVDRKCCSGGYSEVDWMAPQGMRVTSGGAKASIAEIRWRWPVEAKRFVDEVD